MKAKVRIPFLFVSAAATSLISTGYAFSPNGASMSLAMECARGSKYERKTTLFSQDPSMPEGDSCSEKGDPQTIMKKSDNRKDVNESVRSAGKKVGLAGLYGFSFFMNIVGLYFTAGLILNLCGYAYEFSFEEGYKIDTIEHKRIERQFEQESKRYERERVERVAKFSTTGAVDMFGSEIVAKLSDSTK